MAQTKEAGPISNTVSRIEVARALPAHARENQRIFYEGMLNLIQFGDNSGSAVTGEFRDEGSSLVGRTTKQWFDLIMGKFEGITVYNSFYNSQDVKLKDETPKGIVLAAAVGGVRYLRNLYVDREEHGSEHEVALFDRVKMHHGSEEFRIRVPEHNVERLEFYTELGCVATSESGLGYEIQGVFIPQIEMISPAK